MRALLVEEELLDVQYVANVNVFIILSPPQLINALEAKHVFGTRDNVLIVLRHTSQGYPISKFKQLIDEADWDRVYYYATYDEERVKLLSKPQWLFLSLKQRRKLDSLAAHLGHVERLFVGLYIEPIVRHFCHVLSYDTLYVLDDGTGTLDTSRQRRTAWQKKASLASLRYRMWYKLAGIDEKQVENLTYFTVYEDLELSPRDSLVSNHYEHFRAQVAPAPRNHEVWFLGGPLLTDGYFSDAIYRHYLKQIAEFYRGRKLVYIRHGREGSEDLERVAETLGCEVRHFDLPIEIVLNRSSERPAEVASFVSGALPNCQLMFGASLDLTAFEIQSEDVNPLFRPYFADVAKHFRRKADSHFEVVSLQPADASQEVAARDALTEI